MADLSTTVVSFSLGTTWPLCEQRSESGLVEDGYAELLGLGELRPGILSHDDVARLLGHAVGHLATPRLDLGQSGLSRVALQTTGEHHGDTGERDTPRGLGRDQRRWTREIDAGVSELVDDPSVGAHREELLDALDDGRPDAVHRGELLRRGRLDGVKTAEGPGEGLRRGRAHVADVDPDQHTSQSLRLGFFDRLDQVRRGHLTDALQGDELVGGERVDVTGIVEKTRLHELADTLLAQTLDVHGRATREVDDPLDPLRRAVDVHAVGVRLALETHQSLTAYRARLRELPAAASTRLAPGDHRTHHLGDDVTRLAHRHQISDPHVAACHLVFVVERREADGGPSDEHRLELGEGRRSTRTPDAHHDRDQLGGLLLRRVLVGDGPARCSTRDAELIALGEIVDLHHDTIDLVAERMSP